MSGLEQIHAERLRQIDGEGFDAEHDGRHAEGSLARAALAYRSAYDRTERMPIYWPWEPAAWKPRGRVANLVRAGALYMAEGDRRFRVKRASEPVEPMRSLVLRVARQIDALSAGGVK